MKLSSIFAERFGLSFELFPPKTVQGEQTLFEHLAQLLAFQPDFITCTYGAGGTTREKTMEIISRVKAEHQIPVASHLTCVGATREDLHNYLAEAQRRGIDFIVALRGDPPKGQSEFQVTEGGLRYANELVELIRESFPDFGIAVAGYPEVHQEAPSPEADLENLKRKVDAGADIVVTQLFYDNADFFQFRERYDRAGIQVPLVPGILPVTNLPQIQRITSLCGACLPEGLVSRMSANDDPDWQFQVGVEYAIEQVQGLLEQQIPGLHFYVLNKSPATCQVLKAIGHPRHASLANEPGH
jgi:methylenetetrahydrofolate reductase (NADPH)